MYQIMPLNIEASIVEIEAASEIGLDQWAWGATRTPSLNGEKEKSTLANPGGPWVYSY